MSKKNNILTLFALVLSYFCVNSAVAIERPFIWMTVAEKSVILQKIKDHDCAIKHTDDFAPTTLAQRIKNIKNLPLNWKHKKNDFPAFFDQENIRVPHLPERLQLSLQAAIGCRILYNFSQEQRYAVSATDILYTFVKGLNSTPIGIETVSHDNRSWIASKNDLLEARICGEQIPLIYDFIYNYLKTGGQAYDARQGKLADLNFTHPEWHLLKDVKTSSKTANNIVATFQSEQFKT